MRSSREQGGPGFMAGLALGLVVGAVAAYLLVPRLSKLMRGPEEQVGPGTNLDRDRLREALAENRAQEVIGGTANEIPGGPEPTGDTRE